MIAHLAYLGRALALYPGELGELFQGLCTAHRNETEMDYSSGYPRRKTITVAIPLFWYDTDSAGRRVFCAFSGFGPGIQAELVKRGFKVTVENRVDHGLPPPDLSKVKHIIWRPGQKEAMGKLLAYDRGVIVCPTGWGKSLIIKCLAKVYPESKILVTVNSIDIANDLFNGLRYDLGASLGMIGAGKMNPKRVTVCVSQSLHKAPKDVNLVLVDECHTLMTENYVKKLNKFSRAKMFGFTATPTGRSDAGESFGLAVFGPQLLDIGYQESVDGGNVVPIEARIYMSEEGPNVSDIQVTAVADKLGLWANAARNELIASVVRDLEAEVGSENQILIMVDKTEHAYRLGQLLPDFPVVSGEPSPARLQSMRENGAMLPTQEPCTKKMRAQYKEAFENHTLKRAIATKIWSKGVDFRDLAVLVRADGTGSPIDSGQVPGRLSRLGDKTAKIQGILVDFLDTFSSNLQSRSQKRLRVYRKNGFKVMMKRPDDEPV